MNIRARSLLYTFQLPRSSEFPHERANIRGTLVTRVHSALLVKKKSRKIRREGNVESRRRHCRPHFDRSAIF